MISGERGTGACGPGGRYVVVTWSLQDMEICYGRSSRFFLGLGFFWDIQHLFHILKHGLPF